LKGREIAKEIVADQLAFTAPHLRSLSSENKNVETMVILFLVAFVAEAATFSSNHNHKGEDIFLSVEGYQNS
jgi:hypothetical protein